LWQCWINHSMFPITVSKWQKTLTRVYMCLRCFFLILFYIFIIYKENRKHKKQQATKPHYKRDFRVAQFVDYARSRKYWKHHKMFPAFPMGTKINTILSGWELREISLFSKNQKIRSGKIQLTFHCFYLSQTSRVSDCCCRCKLKPYARICVYTLPFLLFSLIAIIKSLWLENPFFNE
jgi:hypothetical protein